MPGELHHKRQWEEDAKPRKLLLKAALEATAQQRAAEESSMKQLWKRSQKVNRIVSEAQAERWQFFCCSWQRRKAQVWVVRASCPLQLAAVSMVVVDMAGSDGVASQSIRL